MANPNIAAISELHVGTLGFNLKTNGVVFVSPRVVPNATTTSWDHPTATSIYGYTLSDTFIMNAQAYDSGRSTTSMSYNSDAMTLVYDEVEFQTDSSGSGALGYKVNPDIGNYDMSVSMGGSGNFANISSFWGNVDQTNPLKTFDGHNYQSTPNNYGFGKVHEVTGGYTDSYRGYPIQGSKVWLANMMDQSCEPGDVGIITAHCDSNYSGMIGYGNTYLLAGSSSASTNERNHLQQFIVMPDGGKNIVPQRFRRFDGGDSSGASYSTRDLAVSLVILQSSRTEDTLFECPSERVLKINSIMATNPESAGTYVNVSLAGLGAVNDTAGSAAVTPTGNDASVRLAQGVKVPMGKPIELLNRPIYMVEGDSLTANAKSSGFMPQDANRGVDIIVSFESMED